MNSGHLVTRGRHPGSAWGPAPWRLPPGGNGAIVGSPLILTSISQGSLFFLYMVAGVLGVFHVYLFLLNFLILILLLLFFALSGGTV